MSEINRCFDCNQTFKLIYNQPISNDKITPIIKNICLNCLDKVIKEHNNHEKTHPKLDFQAKYEKNCILISNDINELCNDNKKESHLIQELNENTIELNKLTTEINEQENTIIKLLEDNDKLSFKEKELYQKINQLEKDTNLQEKKMIICNNEYNTLQKNIKILSSRHILVSLFKITLTHPYGVINYCKLGEGFTTSHFDEINTGLGYMFYLLEILACLYSFVSKNYKILLNGNDSSIITLFNGRKYSLALIDTTKNLDLFNNAMKLFLAYFNEFYSYLIENSKLSVGNDNHYKMSFTKESINSKNIILETDKTDSWTYCIKSLLTGLKYILTQAIKLEDDNSKKLMTSMLSSNENFLIKQ